MRVLVGCEFSGVVRDAFRRLGADAWSCDLLPTDSDPAYHIQADVTTVLNQGWDLAIFHPPCTRLCNSGVRWLHVPPPGRSMASMYDELNAAADLFSRCLNAPIPKVAVENPVMHYMAKARIAGYVEPTQSIQPYQFGHGETKRTCLWLRGLPPLVPTNVVSERVARVHKLPPSEDRWRLRSITYQGIADAMAAQWFTKEP